MNQRVPAFVFAKPTVPGVSKTRLAMGTGPELAARLAAAFLLDTFRSLDSVAGLEPVLATTDLGFDFGVSARRVEQGSGDLGAKLERVLSAGIAEAGAAMAVGADSPGMPMARVRECIDALKTHDAAFVPSEDGGFVVMAVRRLPTGVLSGIGWSSENTRSEVISALTDAGMSVVCVESWFDIDEPEDLEPFWRLVTPEEAPNTWKLLVESAEQQNNG